MILVENKSARHHFEILKTFTAGLVLHGWEVKSIRGAKREFKIGLGADKWGRKRFIFAAIFGGILSVFERDNGARAAKKTFTAKKRNRQNCAGTRGKVNDGGATQNFHVGQAPQMRNRDCARSQKV